MRKNVSFQRNTRFLGDKLDSFLKTDFFKRHFFFYPTDILLPSAVYLKIVDEENPPFEASKCEGTDVSFSFRFLLYCKRKDEDASASTPTPSGAVFFLDFPCSVTTFFYIRVRR